jgi:RNA polymerase sigma-70 factor, ECF subfamily
MPPEPDGDILRGFVRGDEQAFEQMFRQFERDVFGWILRIVRDRSAAEDVLVETFWRAYRGRAQFDPERSFGAWIRRIATNASLDHLRARKATREWRTADDALPAPPGSDRETNDAIARAFRRLPADLQIVAALALLEEQPYADIADALGIPEGTVKSRVFRATRALREELTRLGVRP